MKKLLPLILLLCLGTAALIACSAEKPPCAHPEYTDTVVEATCNTEGYIFHVCKSCYTSWRTDFIAPKGHTLNENTVAPTCGEQGYTIFSCDCGYSFRADFLPPTGHVLQSRTILSTCEAEGYTEIFCDCGYAYRIDRVAPKGHELSETVTPPTCTDQGYTTYRCDCGYTFESDFVKPLGHDFEAEVTHPTSTTTGYTHYRCACGYEYVGDYIMSSDVYKGAYVNGKEILAKGIDISSWNGEIHWDELRAAGIEFVILKAGSSVGKDAAFEENYARAKQEGFGVGCYFYAYATNEQNALADAEMFAEWLAGKQFDYPVYLDMEDESLESLDRELLTSVCKAFIESLQSKGYYCGLYINNNWLKNLLNTEKVTTWFDIWYARWTLSGEATWPDSFGERRMGIWQYSAAGRIGTHDCDFDMNVAFFDYPTYIKSLGFNGYGSADAP